MIKILQGLKRLLYGNTYKFSTRKGSCSLLGASWTPIFNEMTKMPLKLVSIEFLTEKDVNGEFRIICNGEKIFPFGDYSVVENGITRGFIIPIEIASGEYLQIEVRGEINSKNIIILNELACIEVM